MRATAGHLAKRTASFLRDQAGAVTVEWVVLAAIVIGLGMVVLIPVGFGTESSTKGVADDIRAAQVGYGTD